MHEFPLVQFPQALVVGGIGSNLADAHQLVPRNGNRVPETVLVPQLEQGHVKADVRRVEVEIAARFFKKTAEVFDVVHFWGPGFRVVGGAGGQSVSGGQKEVALGQKIGKRPELIFGGGVWAAEVMMKEFD